MKFVQIIDFETTKAAEMNALMDEWLAATEGKRIPTSATLGHDRDNTNRYVEIVEFPSYDDAMRNSDLPETSRFAERMSKLCTAGPTFVNLDVEREELL
ncbi:hypothetical protein [Flindersiella endophytica]